MRKQYWQTYNAFLFIANTYKEKKIKETNWLLLLLSLVVYFLIGISLYCPFRIRMVILWFVHLDVHSVVCPFGCWFYGLSIRKVILWLVHSEDNLMTYPFGWNGDFVPCTFGWWFCDLFIWMLIPWFVVSGVDFMICSFGYWSCDFSIQMLILLVVHSKCNSIICPFGWHFFNLFIRMVILRFERSDSDSMHMVCPFGRKEILCLTHFDVLSICTLQELVA